MPTPTYRTIACYLFLTNVLHFQRCASMQATCDTKLSDLKHSITKVICPGGCWMQHSDLCGTDDYARGPLCLAAMHAGLMDNDGGYFEVFKSDPLSKYEGTKRYDVTSELCYSASFTYSFQMKCSTKGNPEFSVTEVDCPSGCRSNYVCGTNLYNSNSSVCAAAIHAGVLKENGGAVTFYTYEEQTSYVASTKNGVLSHSCDISRSSFLFTRNNHCIRPCQNEGKCLSGINAEFCSCAGGTQGENCEIDIDECTSGTHNCHQHATCINTVGSFQCSCNANYTGDGRQCVPDFCAQNNKICRNEATCVDNDVSYSCSCLGGYIGLHCETDIDECTIGTHNCHQHATCINTAGSFECSCNANYSGDGVDCDFNECTSGTHACHEHAACMNTAGSYECICDANFTGDGRRCEANFCSANVGLCKHNGTCSDTTTSYSCSCDIWHTGKRCEQEHDHLIMATARIWADARTYCQSIGGDLATWGMRNATVRNLIVANMLQTRTAPYYFIGLNDLEQEGVWKYVDGVPVTKNNTDFWPGEPNGGLNAHCGGLSRSYEYAMDDLNCYLRQSAICERLLH